MRILAIILTLLCVAADAPRYREGRGRFGRAGEDSTATTASFVLARAYEFPYLGNDRIPLCTDDATCVAVCAVGAVTGSLTAWECKGHDGLTYGVVTDPGGTVIDSFIPNVKAREITGATAPSLASAALATMLNGSAHTMLIGGMSRTDGSGYEYWIQDTAGWFMARETSGVVDRYDGINTTHLLFTTNVNGYGLYGFRWDGTTGYESTGDWKPEDQNDTIATARNTITSPFYFGTRPAKDLQLSGPAVFYAFYSTLKSDVEVQALADKFYGVYSTGNTLTGGNGYLTSIDNTATTGNVDILYGEGSVANATAPYANASGLRTSKGHTNVWAADPLAAATWTDVNGSTVTSNVSSGPFSVWKKAAECDLIADSSAVAFSGRQSLTLGTGTGNVNASCFLKAGTTGTTTTLARIAIDVTGGTGSTTCDFTGLTSTAARKSCATAVGGSPSAIKASILVGNAAAATGSIQTCQCQLTAGPALEPPEIDNTLRGDAYYTSTDPTAWPNPNLGGKYEVVHTPLFDPLTQWVGLTDGTYYLLDVSTGGGAHTVALIFGYTVAGRFNAVVRGPGGEVQDLVTDGVGLTVGQPYATSIEWRPVGAGKCTLVVRHNSCGATAPASCVATTIVNSDLTGTSVCPATQGLVTMGNRYDASNPTSVLIHAVRVYSL